MLMCDITRLSAACEAEKRTKCCGKVVLINLMENDILNTKGIKYKASLAFILLCSLGAGMLVAVSSAKYGPGITHDSAAYMYAAQSLLNGEGFQYFGYPSPFIQWPPLFPALLALGSLAGLDFGTAATLINSLAFMFIVFFSGRWMLDKFKFNFLAVSGTFLLLVSVPLLQISKYLWTETIFVLFFLLFYIEFERYLRNGRYSSLVLAALFSALACVDRYAGVTIVAVAGMFLLFTKKRIHPPNSKPAGMAVSDAHCSPMQPGLKKIADVAFYGTLSAIPMSIWVLRNYMVSGTLLGVRLPSAYTLRQNIKRSLESVYTWVQPDKLLTQHVDELLLSCFKAISTLLPLIVAAAFTATLARSLVDYQATRKLPAELKQEPGRLLPVAFFTVFSVIYVVYLIASATSVAFEPINSRYLVPIYLPILLTLLIAADYLYGYMEIHFGMKLAKFSMSILLSLFIVYPAANAAASVLSSYQYGAGGVATAAWHDKSGFMQYMENPGQCTYYSNNADAVYALSGIRTYYPPKKNSPYMYGLEQFKTAVSQDESSYIIWFENGVPPTLYSLKELEEMFGLEEVGSFESGTVFRFIK